MKKGIFITFEGPEGSGKSTQSRLLYQYLKDKGLPVLYLREPGATSVGEKIRKILLNPKNKSISPVSEMLLYMAARSQLVDEVIKPALKKRKIVVCDRFLDSTLAYQGYGLGIDINIIKYIGKFATLNIQPCLTIFLDLPVKVGLGKCGRVKDRIERRNLNYHRRVRAGYLALARKFHKRIKVIRVHNHLNKTQEKIRNLVGNVI